MNNTIGALIKQMRKKSGFTQSQLAEKVGISQAMIVQYEQGKRQPKFENLSKIADALDIDVNIFLASKIGTSNEFPEINQYNVQEIHNANIQRYRIPYALELYKALDFTFVEKIIFEDETFSLNYSDDSSGIIGYLSNKPRSLEEENALSQKTYSENEIIKYIMSSTISPKHIMEISYGSETMQLDYCNYLKWINNFIENVRTTALQQLHAMTSNPIYMDEISRIIGQQKLDTE